MPVLRSGSVLRRLTVTSFVAVCSVALGLAACGGGNSAAPAHDAAAVDSEGSGAMDASDVSVVDAPRAPDAHDAGDASDAMEEPDVPFKEAKHALPTVTFNGGPVFAHPLVVTITYSDDPERPFDEAMGAFLVQSNWLKTVGKEYGVGLGTHQIVELGPSPAQIDDTGIQALLLSLIQNGTLPDIDGGAPVPPPYPPFDDAGMVGMDAGIDDAGGDASGGDAAGADAADAGSNDAGDGGVFLMPPVVYMIYFPTSTSVTVVGEPLCTYSGGGYHYQIQTTLGDQTFAYAVISACAGQGTPEEVLQFAASHELIEACTDPSQSAPAYALQDQTIPWSIFGGEVGDMCSFVAPQWSEGIYDSLQRVYSNAAAQDGGDPCVPASAPYYTTDVEPQAYVAVAAGQSTTFNVTGWSTAAVPDWSVQGAPYISSPATLQPTVSLPAATLNNGQKTTLTVGIPAGTPSGSYALVLVYSSESQTDYTSSLVGVYVP
jgi:hypothetical protein